MTVLSITPRTGTVERALLSGAFDRDAFIRAASLVKDRIEAQRRAADAVRAATANRKASA